MIILGPGARKACSLKGSHPCIPRDSWDPREPGVIHIESEDAINHSLLSLYKQL